MRFFVHLWDRGWIYRAERIVNWCPFHETAISDLEVEHVDMDDTLTYARYPFADGSGAITIATVRPATILADVAVAVHPDDERYRDAVGKEVVVPYVERAVPVIADARVEPEFGTGALKITPGHDPTDFEIGRDHGLPILTVIGPDGRMNENAGDLAGKTQQEADEAILAWLKEHDRLEQREHYRHAVGTCERCHTRIEPLVSLQWWVAMEEPRKPALARAPGAPRPLPSRVAAPVRDPLARGDPGLEHLAAALVGPPAAALVLPRRPRHLRLAAAGRVRRVRLGRARARSRRARHVVLVRALAVRDARLARADARARALLPGERQLDRARDHPPLGEPDDLDGARGDGRDPVHRRDRPLDDPGRRRPADVEEPRHRRRPARPDRQARRRRDPLRAPEDVLDAGRPLHRGRRSRRAASSRTSSGTSRACCSRTGSSRTPVRARSRSAGSWRGSTRRGPSSSRTWAAFDFSHSVQALYRLTFDDFCDWYAEAIKPRLREGDEDAAATALAALERLLSLLHPVMPHVTEEIWSQFHESRLIVSPWPEPEQAYAADADALQPVQEAAAMFRRSGVVVELDGDEKRIFDAVVRPERREGERERRRRDRASARRGRARRADAREREVRREREARGGRGRAREARPLPARARCPLRLSNRWLASLSPWPKEFGLGRMRTLLAALGDPQLAYPAIHVVGTNGKSTATRTIEALLLARGPLGRRDRLAARPLVGGADHGRRRGGRLRGGGRTRPSRGRGAGGDAVRDGLRGRVRGVRGARGRRRRRRGGARRPARRDERPPLARRPAHERRARAHRRARRHARADRGREARRRPGGDGRSAAGRGVRAPRRPERRRRRRPRGGRRLPRPRSRARGRGRAAGPARAARRRGPRRRPQRRRRRAGSSAQLDRDDYTVVASILRDKDALAMLSALATRGRRFVATESPNARALPAAELAHLASHHFPEVEIEPDPAAALARAREQPARPRHRLAVPSCGFGEERGVI